MRSNSRERSVACHSFVWFQLMRKKSCFVVLTEKSISHSGAKRMNNLHLLACVGQIPFQSMRYSFWSIAILVPIVLAASVEHRESKGGGAVSAWANFFMSKVSLLLNFISMVNTAMLWGNFRFDLHGIPAWASGTDFIILLVSYLCLKLAKEREGVKMKAMRDRRVRHHWSFRDLMIRFLFQCKNSTLPYLLCKYK